MSKVSLHEHVMFALKAQRDVMDERDKRYRVQFRESRRHIARALAATIEGKVEASARAALILSSLAALLSLAAVMVSLLHKG